MKQIQEACLETCHYGVMHALLGGKAHYRDWHIMHGKTTVRPQDVHKQRKMEFAIAQRDKKGMYLLDATIKVNSAHALSCCAKYLRTHR